MKTKNRLQCFINLKSIMVVGRRWFDKKNGNTYHTSEIYINNEFIHKTEFTYGYGDQYYWTAWDWLMANGYVKNKFSPPRIWCEDNNIKWCTTVSDVGSKKNL